MIRARIVGIGAYAPKRILTIDDSKTMRDMLRFTLVDAGWSPSAVKLTVDAGMLAIALVSLAIRKPFTLQYAVEAVDTETAKLPDFLRANDVITSVWAAAFVLMMLANLMLIYLPGLPLWCGIVIAFAARYSALYFTRWYPERQRAKFTPSTTSAGRL